MPATGDIYAITLQSYMMNQLGENVTHWQVTTAGGSTTAQIATAANAAFEALYRAFMPSTAIFEGAVAQKIWPLPRMSYSDAIVAAAGLATDEALPPQVSGLIEMYNLTAGKVNRGHVYVPFPARDWLDTVNKWGQMNAAGVAKLQAIANQFTGSPLSPAGGTILTYGAYSKTTHAFVALTLNEPKDSFATQKRRSYFGRPNLYPM